MRFRGGGRGRQRLRPGRRRSRPHRPQRSPSDPTVAGGSAALAVAGLVAPRRERRRPTPAPALAGYERADLDRRRHHVVARRLSGASLSVTAEGRDARPLPRRRRRRAWPVRLGAGGTARLDRTAPTAPVACPAASASLAEPRRRWCVSAGRLRPMPAARGLPATSTRPSDRTAARPGRPRSRAHRPRSRPRAARWCASARWTARATQSAWVQAHGRSSTARRPVRPDASAGGSDRRGRAVASLTATTASGSTDAGSGVAGYEYAHVHRRRHDLVGGRPPAPRDAVTAEGETLVQFRAIDGARASRSNWVPGDRCAHRPHRSRPTPTVAGGSTVLAERWRRSSITGDRRHGHGRLRPGRLPVPHARPTAAPPGRPRPRRRIGRPVTGRGHDAWSSSAPSTAPATPRPGRRATAGASNTVQLDRTAPTAPTLTGGSTCCGRTCASVTVTAVGLDRRRRRRPRPLRGARPRPTAARPGRRDRARADLDGDHGRRARRSSSSARWTTSATRSAWTQSTRAPRSHGPDRADRQRRFERAGRTPHRVTVSATGGSDSGGSLLAGYQYRTYTTAGRRRPRAPAWSSAPRAPRYVQFRTVDGAGNTSAWAPSSNGSTNTVKLDRTAPTAPTVSGGSLTCSKTKRTIRAHRLDRPRQLKGVSRYEYHVSTNGGTTWGTTTSGSSVTLSATGSYVVQFRAVDGVGLVSCMGTDHQRRRELRLPRLQTGDPDRGRSSSPTGGEIGRAASHHGDDPVRSLLSEGLLLMSNRLLRTPLFVVIALLAGGATAFGMPYIAHTAPNVTIASKPTASWSSIAGPSFKWSKSGTVTTTTWQMDNGRVLPPLTCRTSPGLAGTAGPRSAYRGASGGRPRRDQELHLADRPDRSGRPRRSRGRLAVVAQHQRPGGSQPAARTPRAA